MQDVARMSNVALAASITVLAGSLSTAIAISAPDLQGRFDGLVVGDPTGGLDAATQSPVNAG
jgi:hypothetical protein